MPSASARPQHKISLQLAFLIALGVWTALSLLDLLGIFAAADLKFVDWRFQLRGTRPVSDALALVEIDDATISAYDGRWPLPRDAPAALIAALGEGGARAIGLDLLFLGRDACDASADTLLVLATEAERGVVHAIAFPPGVAATEDSAQQMIDTLLVRAGVADPGLRAGTAELVATPFPALLGAASALGHVSVVVDRDGVVRRVPVLLRYGDRLYPSLGLAVVQAGYEGGKLPTIGLARTGYELAWPTGRRITVPVDDDGATSIDFAGPRDAFRRSYSMLQVLDWSRREQRDSLENAFRGRIVLIGATSTRHVATDLGTTPFEAATPLVYIHANLIDSLLQDRLRRTLPRAVRLLVLAAIALLLAYFTVRLGVRGALAATAGTVIAFAIADNWLFVNGVDLAPTAGLLLAPLVYTSVQTYRVLFVERRERTRAKELAIATRIQRGLLPRTPPQHPKLDVFGINVPAQEVGGDYYDWVSIEGGGVAIAVGDVEGKGIGAALLMVHLHTSFHAETKSGASARETVEAMHRSLHTATESRQFATFFLGIVDRDATTLRYSSAGHNPALHVRGSSAGSLDATGLPLGMILDGPPYEERSVELAGGDVLVVYSDGITEYPWRDEQYGQDRLAAAVVRLAGVERTARGIANGILQDVRAFAHGGPADDDVTLVVALRLREGVH